MTQPASPPHPLFARLRAETASDHAAVERTLPLTRADLDLDTYAAVLERFLGFMEPWEAHVAGALPDRLADWFAPRRRAAWLREDLRALGRADEAVDALPRHRPAPADNLAACFGQMYVMEGSTLGGAVITRHVTRRLGLSPEHGCRFFGGRGDGAGPMWASFRIMVVGEIPETQYDRVIGAASAMFHAVGRWFRDTPGLPAPAGVVSGSTPA